MELQKRGSVQHLWLYLLQRTILRCCTYANDLKVEKALVNDKVSTRYANKRMKKGLRTGIICAVKSKNITAGCLFKAGSCRIGKTIFDLHKDCATKTKQDEIDIATKAREIYLAAKVAASSVVAFQPDPSKWNIAQLKIMLKPLKMKKDGAITTLKVKMLEAYHLWKDRAEPVFDAVVAEVTVGDMGAQGMLVLLDEHEPDEQELSTEEEAVAAMFALVESSTI